MNFKYLAREVNSIAIDQRISDGYINAKMRILFRGDLYEIQGVTPDNKSGLQWLTIFVAQGMTTY